MKVVFMGASPSIVRWAFRDIIDNPEIEYCDYDPNMKKGVWKYILSRKCSMILPHFLKMMIYRNKFKYDFWKKTKGSDDVVFVVSCQYGMFSDTLFEPFIKFLKRYYPKSKYAFYYNDIIKTCNPESLEMIKKEFDLVLTFDRKDADDYGLEYYGPIYSKSMIEDNTEIAPFDILWVGSDRGRFNTILDVFIKLAEENRKVVFYLYDIWPENMERLSRALGVVVSQSGKYLYKNSVLFCNVYCPYPKTLALISKCKCIVEILLPDQTAGSLRLPEAVVYKRKLLTNCREVETQPYYRENNIMIFSDINDLEQETISQFIESPMESIEYDFSPLKMIDYAVKKIKETENRTRV